jgi:hypothetical protein
MQWAKKLEGLQGVMTKELQKFLAPRMRSVKPADVAQDLIKQAVKIDMNRSAARLRRYLYAQWGRVDLVAGEWFHLGPNGLEERANGAPSVRDLGDLHVDPFRVFSLVKMLGYANKQRLTVEDRVKANALVFSVIHSQCIADFPSLTPRQVATLMVTHAVEANREVEKANVPAQVGRHFPQWNITVPSETDIQEDVAVLARHGALKDADSPSRFRLSERISYPW